VTPLTPEPNNDFCRSQVGLPPLACLRQPEVARLIGLRVLRFGSLAFVTCRAAPMLVQVGISQQRAE
jgi:hypothetical protein